MFKAKIEVEYKDDWSKDLMKKFDCEMKSIYCQNISQFKVIDVIKVKYTKELASELIEFLLNYDYIDSSEILETSSDYIIFQVITNCDTNNERFVKNQCFSLSLKFKDGKEHWIIISNSKENLKNLINDFNDKTRDAKLIWVVKYDYEKDDLTGKQFDVLTFLYRNGYFQIPKNITLDEASKQLGISKSNLNVHMNKSINKLVDSFLDD